MKKIRVIFSALIVLLLVGVVNVTDAKAAYTYPTVSSVTQTNATVNSITYTFVGKDAAKYNIYTKAYSDYTSDFALYTSVTTPGTYTVSNLDAGKKYYIKVVPVSSTGSEGYGRYTAMTTLISKITNLHQEKWWKYIHSLDVKWDKIDAADTYEYIVKTAQGKTIKNSTTSYPDLSLSQIKNEQIYVIQVRAKQTYNGQTLYTDWAKINCFVQPTVTSAKVKNGSLTIKWKKIAGATGYTVYACTKDGKVTNYKRVAKVSKKKNSVTIKKIGKSKIKANKTYYIYVTTKYKSSQSQPVYKYICKGSSVSEGYVK